MPEVVTEIRKSKAALLDIKWCQDGALLLVASEDGRVYNSESNKVTVANM